MLSDARAFRMLMVLFVAGVCLLWESHANAQAEPQLAQPGDWAADFNDAQIACYQGSMQACDSIWTSDRVLMDTFLYDYGRTCGGRVDEREIRRANLSCVEAAAGQE